jgi:hypothetical protein
MTDKELIKITGQFTKGVLGKRTSKDMCFAVCAPLQSYLSLLCETPSDLIEGEIKVGKQLHSHYWLRLLDGRILDPTANQFKTPDGKDMPMVYLGKKPTWYKLIKK